MTILEGRRKDYMSCMQLRTKMSTDRTVTACSRWANGVSSSLLESGSEAGVLDVSHAYIYCTLVHMFGERVAVVHMICNPGKAALVLHTRAASNAPLDG